MTVSDGSKYVTGLEQDDFEVFEDGVKQASRFFSQVQQPIALAILLDTSNSMEDKLATAQEAAIGFVRRMKKDDVIEVWSSTARSASRSLHQRRERARDGDPSDQRQRSTSLYNAIYVSLKELKKTNAQERRRDPASGNRRAVRRRRHLERHRVRRGPGSREAVRDSDLRDRFAAAGNRARQIQRSGVRAAAAVAGDRRARVFPDVGQPSCRRSTSRFPKNSRASTRMAYSSKNPMRNGAWRRIDVRVNKPGLTARTRRGITPPPVNRHHAPAALLLYAAAAAAYVAHFAWRDPRVGRLGHGAAGRRRSRPYVPDWHADRPGRPCAARRHQRCDLGVRLAARPVVSLHRAHVGRTIDGRIRRRFCSLRWMSYPRSIPAVTPRPPVLQSPLFTVHVMSLLFAYASFALACVLGVTYALLFKEIKAKQLGFFYTRLPPLATLDLMNSRAITVGWSFLTLGVVVGGIWAWQSERVVRSARAGDVARGSEDPRRAGVVGHVFVRALCAKGGRLERPPRRTAVRRSRSRSCC